MFSNVNHIITCICRISSWETWIKFWNWEFWKSTSPHKTTFSPRIKNTPRSMSPYLSRTWMRSIVWVRSKFANWSSDLRKPMRVRPSRNTTIMRLSISWTSAAVPGRYNISWPKSSTKFDIFLPLTSHLVDLFISYLIKTHDLKNVNLKKTCKFENVNFKDVNLKNVNLTVNSKIRPGMFFYNSTLLIY